MKFTLVMGLLVAGFALPLQAFSVRNDLAAKSITLSKFVYTAGSTSTPVNRTVTVNPGKTWASEQLIGTKGACMVSISNTSQTFNLSDLDPADVVVISKDGDFKYSIE